MGSFIDGSRDSKYDLHRHVLLSLQLGDGNDRDPNPLCIFILILGDRRRGFFLFSTTFLNSSIMSSYMSRCRLQSRSHVIVRVDVLAMLPSSVASVQFIDDMVSLFTRF